MEEKEKKAEPYYQSEAKRIIDSMLECHVFKDTVTRDDMQGYENLIAYLLEANAKSARRAAEFMVRFNKKEN